VWAFPHRPFWQRSKIKIDFMGFRKIFLILLLGVSQIARASQASGSIPANPYQKIGEHNLFGLQPPPPVAQAAATPPPQIVLNGLTTIFGDKRALFKTLPTADSPKEQSYMLAEGQRAGEIEVLSIDMKAGAVAISNHGAVQWITICKTPALVWLEPTVATGAVAAHNNFSGTAPNGTTDPAPGSESQNSGDGQINFQSGNSDAPANPQPGSSANSGTATDNSGSGNVASNDSSNSNKNVSKPDPWWVTGSKGIEQARIRSRDMVLSGQADPQPLTPLTPAGTPANLIGDGQLFFNHM
jgi:hypothetical protein